MTAGILTFDDLRSVSRLGSRATLATVERWARTSGIKYRYDGRGGIWTTVEAMNVAVGVIPSAAPQANQYSPEMVA